MKRVVRRIAFPGIVVVAILWNLAGQSSSPTTIPLAPSPLPTPLRTLAAAAATPTSCPDRMATIRAFYDANGASQVEASLGFFTEDATLSSWAEGVNSHHMRERHLTGKGQIRQALGDPGLRLTSTRPDGPIYRETKVNVRADRVTFILEPDRLRPNGKPYNPYRVEVVFAECKIKALTVVELVTWL